jgi:hypothetical protein
MGILEETITVEGLRRMWEIKTYFKETWCNGVG